MRPIVPIVQGMTTIASGGFEPLANGAFMLLRLCVLHARGQAQAAGQFPGDDLLRVIAQHDVDFVLARIQIVEQPLRVKRAAGPGDGNENFHCVNHAAITRRKQAARHEHASRQWSASCPNSQRFVRPRSTLEISNARSHS